MNQSGSTRSASGRELDTCERYTPQGEDTSPRKSEKKKNIRNGYIFFVFWLELPMCLELFWAVITCKMGVLKIKLAWFWMVV